MTLIPRFLQTRAVFANRPREFDKVGEFAGVVAGIYRRTEKAKGELGEA